MKSIVLLLAMGMGAAWGQTLQMDCSKGAPACPEGKTCQCKPAPLKCGKYQHLEPVYSMLTAFVLEDRCADDMHPVSEREWQELMARLKKLEPPNLEMQPLSSHNFDSALRFCSSHPKSPIDWMATPYISVSTVCKALNDPDSRKLFERQNAELLKALEKGK